MIKKTLLALFGLVFAVALIAPPKANAEVVVGIGVGARPAYGVVVVHPRRYVYVAPAPAPYVVYRRGYVYPPYRGHFVAGYRPYDYRHEWREHAWRR